MSNTPSDPITGYTAIHTGEPPESLVRFTSAEVIYVESLHAGHWSGRYWSADGRINVPYESWSEDAFRVVIDGKPIHSGWQAVSAREAPRNERGARHFVVELANSEQPFGLKVHTLLDGTAVLTRWLEISNLSDRPAALNHLSVWAGRMWPGQNFTLGYYARDIWACEGWLKWETLPLGTTEIKCDKGQGWDAPFFVVRDEMSGEYFIAHLAWSANWHMDFRRDKDGLAFEIGPSAVNAQRVIAPGETIKSPAVHLGHLSGGLDGAIQAMHDHLRRFVLPKRAPDREALIQYLVPADQGYYKPFDEGSAFKCVDVASAMGAELFLLDAYWWDITLDWEPSAGRFPLGLQPLINYARSKGMLFGLYVEMEGGRGDYRSSKIGKQHPEWFGPRDIIKLSIPEAAAWMESEVRRIIDTYQLDLYRLDYNPGFTFEGPDTLRDGIVENNYWRYYEFFYDLYERIARDYPRLILQQCAAGGNCCAPRKCRYV
jgi:alpha-galactosidase